MILIGAVLSFTAVMSYGQSKGTRKPALTDMLQGQWQSTEDPKSFLLFEKGVLKSRYGSKGAWTSEAIVVSGRCMNEGDKDRVDKPEKERYISSRESDMCWYIESVDKNRLSLTYMARGNTLSYRRVKR